MAPYYELLCTQLGWKLDKSAETRMREENTKAIAEIEAAIADAEKNAAGETEIRDAQLKKAHYLSKIGDKVLSSHRFLVFSFSHLQIQRSTRIILVC